MRKKILKKVGGCALSLVMVFSLSVPAFAVYTVHNVIVPASYRWHYGSVQSMILQSIIIAGLIALAWVKDSWAAGIKKAYRYGYTVLMAVCFVIGWVVVLR